MQGAKLCAFSVAFHNSVLGETFSPLKYTYKEQAMGVLRNSYFSYF
jgi:hypothetical protein